MYARLTEQSAQVKNIASLMQRADFCLGVRLIIVREEEGFVVNCTRSLELRNEPRSIPALKTCGLTNLNLEYSRAN